MKICAFYANRNFFVVCRNPFLGFYSRGTWNHTTTLYIFSVELMLILRSVFFKGKGKAVPLQAWSGPEGSRKLMFPDFMTTTQDGGKVVSLTHRPPLPQEMLLVLSSVRGWVDPRAIVRSEKFYVNEKSTDPSWDQTSDLPNCSTAP